MAVADTDLAAGAGASAEALNRSFGAEPFLRFMVSPLGGLVAEIETAASRAAIAVRGAHVLDWTPLGSSPVLWLSPAARLDTAKAVRGGIPVCWPWFGPHADPQLPAHGLVRTQDWDVIAADASPEKVRIIFEVRVPPGEQPGWNAAATARLAVTVATTLRLELETHNDGAEPLQLTEALHSYFAVGDISYAEIVGLEGLEYLDQLSPLDAKIQSGPVQIAGEVDRLYHDKRTDCRIIDRSASRVIRIEKRGSATTVVWNPWIGKSARLGDMGSDGYRRMICVETANAGTASIKIEPGETHRLAVEISATSL